MDISSSEIESTSSASVDLPTSSDRDTDSKCTLSTSTASSSAESVIEATEECVHTKTSIGGVIVPEDVLQRLFNNCDLSLLDSRVLLLYYALKHSLTKVVFQDLLQLVNLHLPKDVKVFTSIYMLKKFFTSLNPLVTSKTLFYCSCCLKLLAPDQATCDGMYCTMSKVGRFSYIPIVPKLKAKFEGQ